MAAKNRFPWVAVSAVVAVVVVGAVALLQVPADDVRPVTGPELPALELTRIGGESPEKLLSEQLAAYDPAPLFIPSAMNSSGTDEERPGADGPFPGLPAELMKKGPLGIPSPVALPAGPVDGLRLTERASAPMAIGRGDVVVGGIKVRMAQIEAVVVKTGRVALTLSLPASSGDLPTGDWQPLELMGAVTREGLSGGLVVTSSSGSDTIDDYFRSHLRQNVRIGERLSEGFYLFRVGP
jgi:hypothetical protein